MSQRQTTHTSPDLRQVARLLLLAILMSSVFATLARAQTYSLLYNFGTTGSDPLSPSNPGVLAQARDGNLYGTTPFGGTLNFGTVYRVTPAGVLTVIYNFNDTNGYGPVSGVTLGNDGYLYGTATFGGNNFSGTVYKVTTTGVITVLHHFASGDDGASPFSAPVQGIDGNFYGTTQGGGANAKGTVYKLSPQGTETVLYAFDDTHGKWPSAGLVQGTDGSFYGVAGSGGTNDDGVAFKITPAGNFTVLFNFDSAHGEGPSSALIQGNDGNFYGTTIRGGAAGVGTIFKMTAAGAVTVIHDFGVVENDGSSGLAGLVQAADGNLYGGTVQGGPGVDGTLFRVTLAGTGFSNQHNFDGTDGESLDSAMVQHTNGILYGATNAGGSVDEGVFFSLNEGAGSFVSLVTSAGKSGATVGILGQGLTETTKASFNGVRAAKFHVFSDTYMTATVPSGAKTGFVSVVTTGGALKSNKKFRVIP